MRYNIYIDYDREEGGPENFIEFFPEMISPFSIARKKVSKDIDQYFYRLNWGALSFRNNPFEYSKASNNAYQLFEFMYNLSFSQIVYVRFVTDNHTINGYFGRNDCDFDYNRKIVEVTPAILDDYTDILENWKTDVNFNEWVFTEPETTVTITNSELKTVEDWPWPVTLSDAYGERVTPKNLIKETDYDNEGGLSLYFDGQDPKLTALSDGYYGFAGTHVDFDDPNLPNGTNNLNDRIAILGQTGGPDVPNEYGDYELSMVRVYEGTRTGGLFGKRWRQLYCQTEFSRDETVKIDVVDPASEYGYEPPVGDGWHMRTSSPEKIKEGQAAHLWTRKPFNGAYSEDWVLQDEVLSDGTKDWNWNWYKYLESRLAYDNSERSFSLVSTISLRDFLEHILQNTSEDLSAMEVKSTFFWNDYESELEVLSGTTGFNYVSGALNYLNNLKLFFTKDLVELEEGESRQTPNFTLYSALNELHIAFQENLIFFIDSYGNLRIEHKRYSDLKKVALDLTESPLLNFTSQWNYDKQLMFETFEYAQVNAGYPDFTDNIVEFDKIVSNNRNTDLKYESETDLISTDAKYCILNPNDIKDGVVLIAVDDNDFVMNKVGIISKVLETNGFLALSNLLMDFGRYEGVWHNGYMNRAGVYFSVTQRNKIGVEIQVKGIQESLFYITQLGYGLVDEGSLDFENETTKLVLRYRYNSTVNGDLFVLAFQKATDFSGADNTWADIDNYIEN